VNVTLVTKDATLDDLSDGDYREIYEELCRLSPEGKRTKDSLSFDKFMASIGSHFSKALWAKYENGEVRLNRAQRNELRAAMNLPLLPPTVADATAQASPDAAVWSVGDGVPEHVIMVSDTPVTLHVNGAVSTVAQTSNVTGVTRGKFQRKRYVRPCVPFEYAERLAGLVGVSWQDVFERGLQAYENAQ
jgi:hypothetical protein